MVSLIAGLKIDRIVEWSGLKLQGPLYIYQEQMVVQYRWSLIAVHTVWYATEKLHPRISPLSFNQNKTSL